MLSRPRPINNSLDLRVLRPLPGLCADPGPEVSRDDAAASKDHPASLPLHLGDCGQVMVSMSDQQKEQLDDGQPGRASRDGAQTSRVCCP